MPRKILLTALVALWLAGLTARPAQADEGWIINSFASQIQIQSNGTLQITEDISVDFGGLEKHGIFRTIPIQYRYNDTEDRVYNIDVSSVTDGQNHAIPYDASVDGFDEVIKIGDPDVTVGGHQRYVIAYTVEGAMNTFDDHDELFWNVDGAQWPVPKQHVTAMVRWPSGPPQQATCFQGPSGSTEKCTSATGDAIATFESTRRLGSGEQMSVAVALPTSIVDVPPPMLTAKAREFPRDAFDLNPLTIIVSLLILVAGFAAIAWNWWQHGRDRAYLGRYYEAPTNAPEQTEPLFQHEPVVVEFEPPGKLKPAQLGLILDESADPKDVTATIVDLAVRGYLTITDLPGMLGSHDWKLTRRQADETKLLPYERTLLDGLFSGREEVKVSELKGKFRSTLAQVEGQIVGDAMAQRLFTTNPRSARAGWGCLGTSVLLLGGFATYQLGVSLGWGLMGLAIVAVGGLLVIVAQSMSQRSAKGRELLQKTLGFRLYMDTAEKYRQQFAEKAEIFTQLLPYAIVFGVVTKWAKAFEGIDTSAANSSWYVGNAPFQAALLSSSLQSMNSNISSALSAAPPSSGSSSGFGGGGFSGGGGGGGGGGSW